VVSVIVSYHDRVTASSHLIRLRKPIHNRAIFRADIDEDEASIRQVNDGTIALTNVDEVDG
jgi:hypothetical protein